MRAQGAAPVCLVIPPSVFLLDARVFMSLGVLRVAACLEERGVPVQVLDLSGIENFHEAVALHASATRANVFGLTATTPQMPAVQRIVEELRRSRPAARIVLGGPHVTLVLAALKQERRRGTTGRAAKAFEQLSSLVDVLVAGDGEEAVFQAIRPDAPALIDADDPASPLFLTGGKLNEVPFPARHLVDAASYRYSIDGAPAMSLIAQLGCPFECGFCGGRASPSLRRVRVRDSKSVLREVVELHERFGAAGFMLYDDELNVNPRMPELMALLAEEQRRRATSWRLRGFVKAELFTDAQAAAMRRAGFRWILVGFESGSPRVLRNINKRATREQNGRCIDIARRHGLKVKALLSIGHPGESESTVRETHDWLLEAKPDDFDVTIITPYPGTPYYDHSVPNVSQPGSGVWTYTYQPTGDRLHSHEVDYLRVADYYKGDPDGGYRSYVFTDELSAARLVDLRDHVERDARRRLGIGFPPASRAVRFEHSMGQFGLPSYVLRASRPSV